VTQQPLRQRARDQSAATLATTARVVPKAPTATPFLMAAHVAEEQAGRLVTGGHYNGKIEAPRLSRRALAPGEAGDLVAAGLRAGDSGRRYRGRFGQWLDGVAVNLPARAMKGHLWNARHRWSEKPEHYAAIHFHDDDLYDAGLGGGLRGCHSADMKSGSMR